MKRILIVDDEPHVIRIMKLALVKSGYTVDEAGNGIQAIDRIEQALPDVLITDIDMPRMNGRELCMHIAEAFPDRKFIIYVLTSRAEDEHREWTGSMQNLEFLEKPVSVRKLVTRLNNHFSMRPSAGRKACLTAQSTT